IGDEDEVIFVLGGLEETAAAGGLAEHRHGFSVSYAALLACWGLVSSPGQPTDRSLLAGFHHGQKRQEPPGVAGMWPHMAGRCSGSSAISRSRMVPRRWSAWTATWRSYGSLQTHRPP